MVFAISFFIILLFVLWGVFWPQNLNETANGLLSVIIEKCGWFYMLVTFGFLLFALTLAFSKYGSIRLGPDGQKPEYSLLTWFSMLFSAGMGIGLVFWGVAEPMYHYVDPPFDAEGKTAKAARLAMRYAFFHWGLHPWAIYTVIALSIAYFQFRKRTSSLISATFQPLLDHKVNGPLGKAIDLLAIFATAFGVATSLGLGALQINGGLSHLLDIPNQLSIQLVIILILTVMYIASATTGLNKGIKTLSNVNMAVAVGLLLVVLFVGPTSFLFEVFTTTLGGYLQNLISMSLRMAPFTDGSWLANWTLFYWAWWIAWAPFVGLFIARISKGRTIREFVIGALIAPSLFSFLWFSVFGGLALKLEIVDGRNITQAVQADLTSALFVTLEHLPFGSIAAALATVLIITFFVTSADSATYVLGMLSSNGRLNPTRRVRVAWGILQAAIAAVLLVSGGLKALQTASIVAALPFAAILAAMCVSLWKALAQEHRERMRQERERQKKLEQLLYARE